jgi:hypothetical protein
MEALHMRRLTYIILALVLVGLSGASLADEVVTFTNGTSMPVRSHHVEDGMLHVDLGGNAFLAFPEDMVDGLMAGKWSPFVELAVAGGLDDLATCEPLVEGNDPLAWGAAFKARGEIEWGRFEVPAVGYVGDGESTRASRPASMRSDSGSPWRSSRPENTWKPPPRSSR